MTTRIELHPEAKKEIASAYRFYGEIRKDLRMRIRADFDAQIKQMISFPYSFQKYDLNLRIAVLHQFPYKIIYRVDDEVILIIAFAHHRRKPGYWAERLTSSS